MALRTGRIIQDRLALQMVRSDLMHHDASPAGRAVAVDLIENQADNLLRHWSTRLGGQRLPIRPLHRLGVVQLREQIELACRGPARRGHLPYSSRESPMLLSCDCDGAPVSRSSVARAPSAARSTCAAVVSSRCAGASGAYRNQWKRVRPIAASASSSVSSACSFFPRLDLDARYGPGLSRKGVSGT